MSDIILAFVTCNIDGFNLKGGVHILNHKLFAAYFALFFFFLLSLYSSDENRGFRVCLLLLFSFLKIQYLPPGWNGTALLIRDWNVCRDILWMCKETGELWGVLLIKAYPPPSPSSSSWHIPTTLLSFLFFPPLFLSSSFEVWCVRLFNEHFFSFYICAVSQQELWNWL